MAEPRQLLDVVAAAASATLKGGGTSAEMVARVGRVCVELLSVDGVCVSVMTDERRRETVFASDDVMRTVEELQFTLGEGPCFEAFGDGRPVLVPDLADPGTTRWPVFASMVGDYPVRAVFALPIAMGVIRLGTLAMYRDSPGPLTSDEVSAALRVVDIVGMVLLGGNDGKRGADWLDATAEERHVQVHQATGMLTVALGVGAAEAFVRLRAYAFTSGRMVGEIAQDIVTYQLLLDDTEI